MDQDLLKTAARAKSEPQYISTRSEYLDYYKEKYGPQKGSRMAAESLYGTIKNKQGENVSVKNIMRQFQNRGGRMTNEQVHRTSPVYQEAGKKLPPTSYKPEGGSITVTVTGMQGNRQRSWTATLKGTDAYDFVNNPTYATFFGALGYPMSVVGEFEGDDSGGVFVTSVS